MESESKKGNRKQILNVQQLIKVLVLLFINIIQLIYIGDSILTVAGHGSGAASTAVVTANASKTGAQFYILS